MRGPEEAFKEKGEVGYMKGRGCKRGGGGGEHEGEGLQKRRGKGRSTRGEMQ